MSIQCVFNVGEAGGWKDRLFNKLPPARRRPYIMGQLFNRHSYIIPSFTGLIK